MKKTVFAALCAACLILALCAACGSGSDVGQAVSESETFEQVTPVPTAEPTEAPAATAEPIVTAEPEATAAPETVTDNTPGSAGTESAGQSGSSTSGNNSQSGTPAEPPAQDKFSAAQDLIGASLDDLISAIGSPNSSAYIESCLVPGGEDGILDYGSFTVETIRRADGSELVYDVY